MHLLTNIRFEHQAPILFHIDLGLNLVNRLSNGVGLTELNDTLHGRVNRLFNPMTHSNESSIISADCAHDQLDCSLSTMRLTDTSNKSGSDGEKVSDDDFYVDDFESDDDGDACGEQ